MYDIDKVSQKVKALLEQKGAQRFAFTVTESEKRELNTELTDFSLYRTIFDSSLSVTVIQDGKKGSASGSDLTDADLEQAVNDALLGAESSLPDEANDIAEKQPDEVFTCGLREPEMERFYAQLSGFIADIARDYPRISILMLIADHTKTHSVYVNSNGTRFEEFAGAYHVGLEMSASDSEKNTGLDYVGISTNDLDTPLIKQGNIANHLADTQRSLIPASIPEKFEGTVILTPDSLGYFIYMLLSNYVMSPVIMNGTSQWLNRVGERVSSDKVSISLKTTDTRIAEPEFFTSDGYRSQDVAIIENGVLKAQLLNLYAAKKTGRPVVKNTGESLVMEPGDTPLKDMIASVRRGLIVGGFSGGEPGANGEFSGVAKNSFYVENGQIIGAVTETMINGNLEKLFQDVLAVSKEQVCDGSSALPYMAASGIVISGK